MAKYSTAVILLALALFTGAMARATKKATTEKSTLDQLTENAQNLVNNFTQTVGLQELPDSKKVVEVLNNNAQTLATRIQEVADKLKTEASAHKGEFDSVIKSVEKKLSEAATSLQQAAGPEATAKAKEIRANLESGLKTTLDQVDKLVKAVEPDATKAKTDIQNAAKTILDQVVEITNNIQTQIKATVAEHEKTHGKH